MTTPAEKVEAGATEEAGGSKVRGDSTAVVVLWGLQRALHPSKWQK